MTRQELAVKAREAAGEKKVTQNNQKNKNASLPSQTTQPVRSKGTEQGFSEMLTSAMRK